MYRSKFQPSAWLAAPRVMVGSTVIVAPSDDEARFHFSSLQQAFLNLRSNRPGRLPPGRKGFEASLDRPGSRRCSTRRSPARSSARRRRCAAGSRDSWPGPARTSSSSRRRSTTMPPGCAPTRCWRRSATSSPPDPGPPGRAGSLLEEPGDRDRLIRHLGALVGLAPGELQLDEVLADAGVRLVVLVRRRRRRPTLVPGVRGVADRQAPGAAWGCRRRSPAAVVLARACACPVSIRMASFGQASTHSPQTMQRSSSMTNWVGNFSITRDSRRRRPRLVLAGLDVDALRRADGRAHVAGHAAGLAVFARHQPVQAAVPGRVGRLLLGVLHRGDQAGARAVEDLGVGVALAEEVAEEVAGGDGQARGSARAGRAARGSHRSASSA